MDVSFFGTGQVKTTMVAGALRKQGWTLRLPYRRAEWGSHECFRL